LITSEKGDSDFISLVLDRQPAAAVKICLTPDVPEVTIPAGGAVLGSDIDCPHARVEFSTTDWYVPRSVTITGVNDGIPDGDRPFVINVTGVSGDGNYSGVFPGSAGTNLEILYMYVTKSTYTGNLGGLAGADAKCMADSNYPGTGTFKAFLTDDDSASYTRMACFNANCSPSNANDGTGWILKANTSYYRVNSKIKVFTTNASRIPPFPFINSLLGTNLPPVKYWSGISPTWVFTAYNLPPTVPGICGSNSANAWTVSTTSGAGGYGLAESTSATFVNNAGVSCNAVYALVCVEQ
jgi:hypothetical protein